MFRNFVFTLMLIGLFTQCTEAVKPAEIDSGQQYYPLAVDNYWIYDVTETIVDHDDFDSVKFQIREIIDTVYTNLAGEKTYKIIRSRRSDLSKPWEEDSLVLVNTSWSDVRRSKNNIKTVSLVFPVNEGKEWNANAFNTQGEQAYRYRRVKRPFVLHGLTYDSTATIVQGEADDVVLDNREEVYAYNIGLIYKKFLVYEYFQENGTLDKTKVARGYKQVMKLNSFRAAVK